MAWICRAIYVESQSNRKLRDGKLFEVLAEKRNNIYMGRDEARISMKSATVRLFSELTLIVYCSVDEDG